MATKTASKRSCSTKVRLPKEPKPKHWKPDPFRKAPVLRDFCVARTGNTSILATGWDIVCVNNQYGSPGDRMRYNSIQIMETVGGSLILRIGFHSQMDGEPAHYTAWVLRDVEEVVAKIFSYDVRVGIKALVGVDVEKLERNYQYLADHAVGLWSIRETVA